MKKSSSKNTLKLNLNESLTNSNSSKNIQISKTSSKKKTLLSSISSSSHSSKTPDYKDISSYFNYNDKVEKKMYLENISIRTKRNTELLSKLSSTFRSYRMHGNGDPLIESNLFRIGSKRSFLLTKRMNQVRNMIQNFDNEFSVNLNINNTKHSKKKENRKYLQKIEEESFDFDLNNINSKNQSKIDLENNKDKGEKFVKNNIEIEKTIKNSEKFSQLTDAFKYYELLYNYKYFITKKDTELLSFSRRKKLQRAFSLYMPTPKTKLYDFEETCEKCNNSKKSNFLLYKDSLNKALKNSLSDGNYLDYKNKNKKDDKIKRENTDLKNKKLILKLDEDLEENNHKNLKRAFSGLMPKNSYNKNNIFITNSKFNSNTRPTTSSMSQTQSKFSNSNNIKMNSKIKSELDLESVISNTSSFKTKTNFFQNNRNNTTSPKTKILSIKKKIKSLSKEILDTGDKLKIGLKSEYNSIMKQIESSKQVVKKVKKDRNINIKKIRKDLNLKRRGNGIDEIKLIMDNVEKLPKNHIKLMRSIAKIVINEDRMKHRPLFYDDTYDNKLFKMRLKKEMFEAECEMGKIRKTLSKNKKEKDFKQQVRKLMENEMFLFFNINSLKQMINKYKVLRGECLGNSKE